MVVGILNSIQVKSGVHKNVYRMHIPSVQSLVYSYLASWVLINLVTKVQIIHHLLGVVLIWLPDRLQVY